MKELGAEGAEEFKKELEAGLNSLTIWIDAEEISDEELEHIFDRFYTGKNGNTGIGLALAKELIELHGWSIRAEKKDGGVLFRIKTEK